MIWRNLNLFFAALYLGSFALAPVVMLLTYLATLGGADVRIGFLFIPLGVIALLALLGWTWFRRGLAPRSIRPDRRKAHAGGHCLLGLGNLLGFAPVVAVLILYAVGWQDWRPAYNPTQRLIEKGVPWVMPATLALLVSGLALIFSSRAPSSRTPPAGHL